MSKFPFVTDDPEIRDNVLLQRLNKSLSWLDYHLDEDTRDDTYYALILGIPALFGEDDPENKQIRSLTSQELIPPLIQATRFDADIARRISDLVINSPDAQPVDPSEFRLLPYDNPKKYVFDPTVRSESSEYADRIASLFPSPHFQAYYHESNGTDAPEDQVRGMLHTGGYPVAAFAASLLKQQSELHPDTWGNQVASSEGLLDAGFRMYTVIADHLFRSKLVPVYGVDVASWLRNTNDVDTMPLDTDAFPGATDRPDACVASVTSHLSTLPTLLEDTYPMIASIADYIFTHSPGSETNDKLITAAIGKQVANMNATMVRNIFDFAQLYGTLQPVGEQILFDERVHDALTTQAASEVTVVRTTNASMIYLIEYVQSNLNVSDKVAMELRTLLEQASNEVVNLSQVTTKALQRIRSLQRPIGTSVTGTYGDSLDTYVSELMLPYQDVEEEEEETPNNDHLPTLWSLGVEKHEPFWMHSNTSNAIMADTQRLWAAVTFA